MAFSLLNQDRKPSAGVARRTRLEGGFILRAVLVTMLMAIIGDEYR